MFKKRTLLLGAAVAAFGAIMAGAAFANPTGSTPTGASAPVSVQAPVASASLTNHVFTIPANGSAHRTDDIEASAADPDYPNIRAIAPLATTQGLATGCSGTAPTNSVVDTPPLLPQVLGAVPIKLGELQLLIPVNNPNACSVSGAVVTVTFEAF